MMNTLTNLQWFNIEGKKDRRSDKQSNCECCSPVLASAKPTLVQHVACYCTERGSVSVCECMCMSEQSRYRCFLLPDEEKRRMPQRSPRCRVGHFDFSEEVVGKAHLSAPR